LTSSKFVFPVFLLQEEQDCWRNQHPYDHHCYQPLPLGLIRNH